MSGYIKTPDGRLLDPITKSVQGFLDGSGQEQIGVGGTAGSGISIANGVVSVSSQFKRQTSQIFPTVQVMFDGDSKSDEPKEAIKWLTCFQPYDIELNYSNAGTAAVGAAQWTNSIGVGGSQSNGTSTTTPATNNTSLTSTVRLANMALNVGNAIASGYAVDMVLTIGVNDIGASVSPETVIANVIKYHNAFRTAGGRHLILMNVDPTAGSTAATISLNTAYRQYCRSVPDAIFADTTPYFLDTTSSIYTSVGNGNRATVSGVLRDGVGAGLHCSGYGRYAKRLALQPAVQQLYRKKPFALTGPSDVYNASTAPRGNVHGAQGRFTAIGGTNSGAATFVGTPPLGWATQDDTSTAGLTMTWTVTTNSALDTLTGSTGSPVVRLVISGTPTVAANGVVSGTVGVWEFLLKRDAVTTYPANCSVEHSMLMYMNSTTGLHSFTFNSNQVNFGNLTTLGVANSNGLGEYDRCVASVIPNFTGFFQLDGVSHNTTNTPGTILNAFRFGGAVNGVVNISIDFICATNRILTALPAASA
jgi:hypothetical protein